VQQLSDEQRAKLLELVDVEGRLAAFKDDHVGPWFMDHTGDPWRPGRDSQPPARHPRRCHSVSSVTGRRCGRWALCGRDYCQFHGGRASQRSRGEKMPVGYSKYLMPSLAERLQDFLTGGDYQEQLRLYEEIALARTLLSKDLELLNALHKAVEDKNPTVTPEVLLTASQHVRRGTEHVADLCSKMAGIEKSMADRVGVQQLGFFVEQITRVIYQRLGPENEELAKQLAVDLKERVKLPADPDHVSYD
jgi:hypothetical protein